MAGRNSIVLKGAFIRKEAEATVAVRPGMLVTWDGAITSVKPQTNGAPGGTLQATRKAFAIENDLIGRGIDDNYAIGDTVQYGVFQRGSEVQALLATGNNAAIGTALVSSGAGNLKVSTGTYGDDDEEIVGYAMEALNNTSGSDARLRVEVA